MMKTRIKSIFFVTGLTFALGLVVACATSPEGRKQLVLLPDDQMNSMGVQAFSDMKQKQPIEKDASANTYVRCVTDALLPHVRTGKSPDQWEVVVFKEDSANAFALPGGKVGVHTGLLRVATSPSQLAAVIGHEIGHVIAQHGNERVSQTVVAQVGLAGVGLAMKDRNKNYDLIMAGLGLGTQFGVLLPHGRAQESEADIIGLKLMSEAGFDPKEAITLWQNMGRAAGSHPPEFLSTHPSPSSRIANIQKNLGPAEKTYLAVANKPNCRPPQ